MSVGYFSPSKYCDFATPPKARKSDRRRRAMEFLRRRKLTHIYAVASGNAIKFGIALDPRHRFANLQTGCPQELKFIGALRCKPELEPAIHRLLAAYHLRGEWFKPSDLAMTVAALIEKRDLRTLLALTACPELPGAQTQPTET